MYEWSTAVLSHNAGSTDAMDVSFLHLAISYAISERSLARRKNQAARIVVPSSLGQPREMDTWHTTSASHGGILKSD
jgi:hypothetical protein